MGEKQGKDKTCEIAGKEENVDRERTAKQIAVISMALNWWDQELQNGYKIN